MSAERQRLLNAIEQYKARTPELSKDTEKALQGLSKELEAPEARDTPGSRAALKLAPGATATAGGEAKLTPGQRAAQADNDSA